MLKATNKSKLKTPLFVLDLVALVGVCVNQKVSFFITEVRVMVQAEC